MLSLSGDYRLAQRQTTIQVAAQEVIIERPRRSAPVQVEIPGILEIPVEKGVFNNGQWSLSETNALHAQGSAEPGERGNMILYGHNKDTILGKLALVKLGDTVTVTSDDGLQRHYVVKEKQIVPSSKTS